MPSADQTMRTYRELAEDYGRQGQAQMRDRFLVLAADAALAAGQKEEAERLRGRLLLHNPHHLLKPYSTFAEAMKSADVQNYVGALRRSHPYEKAEGMLEDVRRSGQHAAIPPSSGSEPRVLRVVDGTGESGPHAKPVSSSNASSPLRPVIVPQSAPASPSRPSATPAIVPLRRNLVPAATAGIGLTDREERERSPGAWVSTGLFLLTLVAGMLVAVYTFLRPFLPQAWF